MVSFILTLISSHFAPEVISPSDIMAFTKAEWSSEATFEEAWQTAAWDFVWTLASEPVPAASYRADPPLRALLPSSSRDGQLLPPPLPVLRGTPRVHALPTPPPAEVDAARRDRAASTMVDLILVHGQRRHGVMQEYAALTDTGQKVAWINALRRRLAAQAEPATLDAVRRTWTSLITDLMQAGLTMDTVTPLALNTWFQAAARRGPTVPPSRFHHLEWLMHHLGQNLPLQSPLIQGLDRTSQSRD